MDIDNWLDDGVKRYTLNDIYTARLKNMGWITAYGTPMWEVSTLEKLGTLLETYYVPVLRKELGFDSD